MKTVMMLLKNDGEPGSKVRSLVVRCKQRKGLRVLVLETAVVSDWWCDEESEEDKRCVCV
jgi:hypothetical protein